MNLEIDAGNTRVKWRLVDSGNVHDRGNLDTRSLASIQQVVAGHSVQRVLISSVLAGSQEALLMDSCREATQDKAEIVVVRSRSIMAGVQFCYEDVSRLGIDRCLAMIAAFNKVKSSVLVVDAGSALTADFVSDSGEHLGGYILPGYRLLKSSLLSGTEGVLIKQDEEASIRPGTATESCVSNGLNLMLVSTLKSVIELARRMGVMKIVFCGGDASRMAGLIEGEQIMVEPDLVFEGLEIASSPTFGSGEAVQ